MSEKYFYIPRESKKKGLNNAYRFLRARKISVCPGKKEELSLMFGIVEFIVGKKGEKNNWVRMRWRTLTYKNARAFSTLLENQILQD